MVLKRFTLFFACLLMAVMSFAANSVTINDGTNSRPVPFESYYTDGTYYRSQWIVPAADLEALRATPATGATLHGITLYYNDQYTKSPNTPFEVYLKNVSGQSISSTFITTDDATLVYSGTVSVTAGLWEVLFTTDFDWTGGDILVDIRNTDKKGYFGSSSYGFYGKTTSTIYSVRASDNSSSTFTTGSTWFFAPKMTFITASGCADPVVSVTNVETTSADLSWTGDASQYEVAYGSVKQILTTNSLQLTGLTSNTKYNVSVRAICAEGDTTLAGTVSFITECGQLALPWSEDFETADGIRCWILPNQVKRGTWNGSNGFTIGNYNLQATGDTGEKPIFILPDLGDVNGQMLSFYYMNELYSNSTTIGASTGQFDAGYVTDVDNVSTFVQIGSTFPKVGEKSKEYVQLSGIPAGARLAFRYHDSHATNWYCFMDNVAVGPAPSVLRPENLTTDNITRTSAHLSWTSTAAQHHVNVTYGSTTLYNGVVNANELTLTGLEQGTLYQNMKVRVAAISNTVTSDTLKRSITFQTECGPLNIATKSYHQSFEDFTDLNSVPCWDFNVSSGYPQISSNSIGANGTTTHVYLGSQQRPSIVMPEVADNVNTLMLSFWTKGAKVTKSENDSILIGVMTDPDDENTFVRVAGFQPYDDTWRPYECNFEAYQGTGKYVAFRHVLVNSGTAAYLDEVTLSVGSCVNPYDIRLQSSESNSVTIAWDGSSSDYHVLVKNGATTLYDADVTGKQATISGLTPRTSYTLTATVSSICGEGNLSGGISQSISVTTPASEDDFLKMSATGTTAFAPNFSDANETGHWIREYDGINRFGFGTVSAALLNSATSALYITTKNNASTYTYTNTTKSAAIAYRGITFVEDVDSLRIGFDWMANGESTYDFGRALLIPADLPISVVTDGISVNSIKVASSSNYSNIPTGVYDLASSNNTTGGKLNLVSTAQHLSKKLTNVPAGNYVLAFLWYNDATSGNQSPLSVCNVNVQILRPRYELSVSAAGYATYFDSQNAYTMPANMEGYAWNNGLVKAYDAEAVVPANVALVLKAAQGDYTLNFTTGGTAPAANALLGTDEATALEADASSYFYGLSLANTDPVDYNTVGFYWMAADGAAFTNGAHKAYLKLAKGSGAPDHFLFTDFEDNDPIATDVETVNSFVNTTKRLVNGQLFIIREGKMFNVNGQVIK